jgi:hypothetical protein
MKKDLTFQSDPVVFASLLNLRCNNAARLVQSGGIMRNATVSCFSICPVFKGFCRVLIMYAPTGATGATVYQEKFKNGKQMFI